MAEVIEVGPTCRLHGTTAVKQILYGNRAVCLQEREDNDPTHQWTVYLKPFKKEDLSVIIKEVHFKLHTNYANRNRVVTRPPYEVTETGCTEFIIAIEIFFRDPFESSVTLYHHLKLRQPAGFLQFDNVVSEHLEELFFTSPSQMMYDLLIKTGANSFRILGDERKYKEIAEKHHCTVLAVATTLKREVAETEKKLKKYEELATLEEIICTIGVLVRGSV